MPFPSHAAFCISARVAPLFFQRIGQSRWAVLAAFFCVVGYLPLAAQTLDNFGVAKKLDYLQSSNSAPVSHVILGDPIGPFHFLSDIEGSNLNLLNPAPKIALPNATQYTLTGTALSMGLTTNYSSKASLDAAFPNGTYTITAGGSSLPLPLGANDAYPGEIPQVTGGSWDAQGNLVINATAGSVLNFNDFSGYATGVGGIIIFDLYAVSGTSLGTNLTTVTRIALNGYSSDAALTSYTIPAGFLQADRTYYAELSFTRIVNLNTTFVSSLGAVGMASFVNTTGLMISTTAPAVAPLITTQPASQTVTVGANISFTVAASGNPTPTFQWRKGGTNIGGATFASFSLSNVQLADAGSYSVVASNGAGLATSETAVLTVNAATVAPTITMQPVSQTVTAGNSVTFTAAADGTPAPTYQWKKDGINIGGATNATYIINSVSIGDAGSYTMDATNTVSSVTTSPATLTVSPIGTLPAITVQPLSQTVIAGNPVTFTAAANGMPTPTFQWQKNGTNILGATSSSYVIASVVGEDEAAYTVVATNAIGAVTSNAAQLSVVTAPSNATVSIAIE